MKYIKKPIPVEAVQISEDKNDFISNYPQWFCDAYDSGRIKYRYNFNGLIIDTLEGEMYALGAATLFMELKVSYIHVEQIFLKRLMNHTKNKCSSYAS